MKKWILTFILISIPLLGQNFEPSQRSFYWSSDSTYKFISADSAYFKQDKPILGWHWGGTYKISKSLLVNQIDLPNDWVKYGFNAGNIDSNYHVVLKPKEYSHGVGPDILNARGIQFEPTLKLDPNDPSKLVTRAGDTTRPVFGFTHIKGLIPTNPSDPNFNRLIINKDSSHLVGQVILDEPWPKNQFWICNVLYFYYHNLRGEL